MWIFESNQNKLKSNEQFIKKAQGARKYTSSTHVVHTGTISLHFLKRRSQSFVTVPCQRKSVQSKMSELGARSKHYMGLVMPSA